MSELHKFIFEGMAVRGMLVRLTDGWQEVVKRRAGSGEAFAAPVRSLLGEMAAASVLMQSNIRFDGALVLQIFGDGPVKLAVAEVQSDLAFRVTAKVIPSVAETAQLEALVNVHGHGRSLTLRGLFPRTWMGKRSRLRGAGKRPGFGTGDVWSPERG